MILIPENQDYFETLKDSVSDSTDSYRILRLYGKSILITPDNFYPSFKIDSSHVISVKSGLYSREAKSEDTLVAVDHVVIGGKKLVVAAGPCAVESRDQLMEIATGVKDLGSDMIRGGAFKPRTSPYSFQGLGVEGLKILAKAKEETGMPVVSEIMDISDFPYFQDTVDMIQIGSRNSQNFSMLKFIGEHKKPVLLKNGMGNSTEEWLSSAEYLLSGGNGNVVLCYRGTRGFERRTRFMMDTGSIAVVKSVSHLPVCADPSHPSGNRDYVESLALAAVASGVHMLEIEVHNNPEKALSDRDQQISFETFGRIVKNARRVRELLTGDTQ
ncbi:3-deoxy-7-phosphoheptulonate synthase [Oxyplasma meridianum]|uniref:3-deoxy-7-phosphoheptulonate synthase n=1 Tax=Oxyplasma meridianum TaxID=3073602 RepID=A0AAX4NEW7_9ARCH